MSKYAKQRDKGAKEQRNKGAKQKAKISHTDPPTADKRGVRFGQAEVKEAFKI